MENGKASPIKKCEKCGQEIPGQKISVINYHCNECGKTWKTPEAFEKAYKKNLKNIRKTVKENL